MEGALGGGRQVVNEDNDLDFAYNLYTQFWSPLATQRAHTG